MKRIINKLVLLSATCLFSSNLFAQETICYKNNVDKPSMIEEVGLEGDICKGKLTVNDMKNDGWDILDIKITSSQNKFNYSYYFYKNSTTIGKEIQNSTLNNNFSIKPIGVKLGSIQNNQSTINVANLKTGQSGIVVHIFENDKRMIVSNAKVISSNSSNSIVEFFDFDDLKQEAVPTSMRKAETGDVLVLNYMYNSSLLIAPNQNAFQRARDSFKTNNFIHSDIFAAKLKIENNPYPTKEDIQQFAIEQNLGTIFLVLDKKIFVIDTKTFTILQRYTFNYETSEMQMPFYTRVEEIEGSVFDVTIPFIGEQKIDNYEEYYKRILGIE